MASAYSQAFLTPTPLLSTSFQTNHLVPHSKSPLRHSTKPITASLITILDYGAGNVRSLENAVRLFGHDIKWAKTPADIQAAEKLIFPGVGSFGAAMQNLQQRNFVTALQNYINEDRPFLGICLGLHTLFEASEESPGVAGLGIFPGVVQKFNVQPPLAVPHIGWNTVSPRRDSVLLMSDIEEEEEMLDRYYFVHSYRVGMDVGDQLGNVVLGTTRHGEEYVSMIQRGQMCATQFHPEKSGASGLRLIRNFLQTDDINSAPKWKRAYKRVTNGTEEKGLAKRVVACLDVRENDEGDLVVTKGDQYDVREKSEGNAVRNLGKPVELAKRYFEQGADEVCFLNITSFRGEPVGSTGMIEVLERTSREVFVPLCIGGGIRDYTDGKGKFYSALDVAAMYFRAGADKVSIGSDAVYAAEKWMKSGEMKGDGSSSIERISKVYGAQAVVISVDAKRVYVESKEDTEHETVELDDGRICWYQCTVKGGREGRDVDVVQLVKAVESLGAGEVLVNCMDRDGQNDGFELKLVEMVRKAVGIPVIASSGAGKVEHFIECFDETGVEAALAAGIFHREEVSIGEVKEYMKNCGTPVRLSGSIEDVISRKKVGAV